MEDIEVKTGILRRHVAEGNQTASDLGALAAERLFLEEKVQKDGIDLLIFVTQSPDYPLPTSACLLQHRLGLSKSCMAFDVGLGCSGFVYGLATAGALIESGVARKGLLVCGETYSKYIDRSDRTCRPIFSDGASASLIAESSGDDLGPFVMGTDGSGFRNLIVASGGARFEDMTSAEPRLRMDGSKVFMFTMDQVPKCVAALLEKSEKALDDVDLFFFHQASKLVIDNIVRRLRLPKDRVYTNFERVGNTVSASIPIALKDAADEGRIRAGDLLMLVGFGVGYSWGGCLLTWGGAP